MYQKQIAWYLVDNGRSNQPDHHRVYIDNIVIK